ncbi:hypothetical protein NDU88_006838 [Pleurodeles waltl]|uniref:Uncharacterized protein n=1 Tax=Pleurodeles waltl TaxID=8319 RepID=A0AAV7SR20_PLEWA|nr:hypothetical protein NDU88_006838 [Pleurodeles waltl]
MPIGPVEAVGRPPSPGTSTTHPQAPPLMGAITGNRLLAVVIGRLPLCIAVCHLPIRWVRQVARAAAQRQPGTHSSSPLCFDLWSGPLRGRNSQPLSGRPDFSTMSLQALEAAESANAPHPYDECCNMGALACVMGCQAMLCRGSVGHGGRGYTSRTSSILAMPATPDV